MPSWNQILEEINNHRPLLEGEYDVVRRKYLDSMHKMTKRNVIAYYSGWLQKPNSISVSINDMDKNGFMATIHELDRSKGLDLILHTPGGESGATESLVYYLKSMFGMDIRTFVPQLAMSAGTIIACASKVIYMGKHSSLGPIDPQVMGRPASAAIEEFKRAYDEILTDPSKAPIWHPILSQFDPTFISSCEKAIESTKKLVEQCLTECMFSDRDDATSLSKNIVKQLNDHGHQNSHNSHLDPESCRKIGLEIQYLEDDQQLQEVVLSIHHSFIHTLSMTSCAKIIENHQSKAFILQDQPQNR